MNNKILKIEKVIEIEDYSIYSDTDSIFFSALPIIKHTLPHIDLNNEGQMSNAILKVAGDVQTYVNKFFDVMANRFFNLKTHRFDIKQEVIAKTSFWSAKKRYAQLIINKGGIPVNELEIKGFDVVRSSFPFRFRSFMNEFLLDFLNKVDIDVINGKILDFEKNIKKEKIIDLGKNTSVKFSSGKGDKNYNPKTRKPFAIIGGSPAQVKAALHYNDLLEVWGLDKQVPKIMHGQKIKWVYLKENEFAIDCIAFKADGTDPDKILEFIEEYIDRNKMYDQELKSKLLEFYEILKWKYPDQNDLIPNDFF